MQKNWPRSHQTEEARGRREEPHCEPYGKFVGEPLEARLRHDDPRNSLRRVLLSSLYGAAISAVRTRYPARVLDAARVTEDVTDNSS